MKIAVTIVMAVALAAIFGCQPNSRRGGGMTEILVKGSEHPAVQLRIAATKDAAIGTYLVSVTGPPKAAEPTATTFTVKVVAR